MSPAPGASRPHGDPASAAWTRGRRRRGFRSSRAAALVILLVASTACASGGPGSRRSSAESLEGAWTLCLAETTKDAGPFCGPLTATLTEAEGQPAYYRIQHELPLDSLFGVSQPLPSFGVIAPAAGDDDADTQRGARGWRLLLGVEEGVVMVYDAGLHGELAGTPDSLEGTWSHMCFAGCPEHGTVTLRR